MGDPEQGVAASVLAEVQRRRPSGSTGLATMLLEVLDEFVAATGEIESADLRDVSRTAVRWRPNRGALAFAAEAIEMLSSEGLSTVPTAAVHVAVAGIRSALMRWRSASAELVGVTLGGVDRVLTICNSTSVIQGIQLAAKDGGLSSVVVLETRPDFDGVRTAQELGSLGLDVTVVTDSALGSMITSVDAVLVGADLVSRDGWLLNRIGTATAAIVAESYAVPFYSAAPYYTSIGAYHGDLILQERDPGAMLESYPLSGDRLFTVLNIPDDLTPHHRVTSYLCGEAAIEPGSFYHISQNIRRSAMDQLISEARGRV